ncbi:MAG: hypothetical protein OK456_07230 [Thaumarchaeota archaeon]|nr:hypothetical protein [Nitrososphaerota archaeon]
MQTPGRKPSSLLIAMFVLLIIVGAGFAYYTYSTGSTLASLSSASSALGSASSSQSRQITSLQSFSGTSTKTLTQTETTTLTHTTAATTVTSETTTTVTSTVALTQLTSTVTVSKSTTVTSLVTTTEGGPDFQGVRANISLTAGGNGTGSLTIQVMNTGYDTITGIDVAIPGGPDNTVDLCANGCSITLFYNGAAVAPSTPLPGGATAAGFTTTDEGVAGTSYTLSITFTYGDGNQQAQTVQVVAAQQ